MDYVNTVYFQKLFDLWFTVSGEEPPENTIFDVNLLESVLGLNSTSAILDLCCGTGRHLKELYKRKYVNLTGVDISGVAIERAKKTIETGCSSIKLNRVDFFDFLYSSTEYYELIYSFDYTFPLYDFDRLEKLLSAASARLSRSGVLVVEMWDYNAVSRDRVMDTSHRYKLKKGALDYKSTYNALTNRLEFKHKLYSSTGEVISFPDQIHYVYTAEQIQELANKVGLSVSNLETETSFSNMICLRETV